MAKSVIAQCHRCQGSARFQVPPRELENVGSSHSANLGPEHKHGIGVYIGSLVSGLQCVGGLQKQKAKLQNEGV